MNKKNKTILIIEDDANIRKLMNLYLTDAGYEVMEAKDGKEAKVCFLKYDPCFVILDLMLPIHSGEEICQWIREEERSNIPIIMVSAKTLEKDRINGLRLGADDYITKPFSPSELVIRVETVLRRTADRCQKISVSNLVLKPQKGEVKYEGKIIELTAFEFRILQLFMTHPGQVFTREHLLNQLYKRDERAVTHRTIDVHVRHLRQKMQASTKKEWIHTVRGMGYKFERP
ncbi:response regulator transcription factor [Falsibacillus pallidus]|uniref:response regulator transcription factor n=1 Tax=Falsibacillus pallidus TaxID=493781 RepID=UPI003D977F98